MNNQRDKHRFQSIFFISIICILLYFIFIFLLKDRWDLALALFPITIFVAFGPIIIVLINLYLLTTAIPRKNYFHIFVSIVFIIIGILPYFIAKNNLKEKRIKAEESIRKMNEEGKKQEEYIKKLMEEGRLE